MQIIISKYSGFCPGVENAIRVLEKAKSENKKVFLSSELIHNKIICDELNTDVLKDEMIDENKIREICDAVVISAHGIDRKKLDFFGKKGLKIYDATCPVVQFNIDSIKGYSGDVIYIGDAKHSEVRFLKSFFIDRSIVYLTCVEDCTRFLDEKRILNKPAIFVQTTFSLSIFDTICNMLQKVYKDIVIKSSICPDCKNRRIDAENLAKRCGCVVVVGDDTSSNARELFNIAKNANNNVFLVCDKNNFDVSRVRNFGSLGVISSASSAKKILLEVIDKIQCY